MRNKPYHIHVNLADLDADWLSDEQVVKWATDPNCIEREACANALVPRQEKREAAKKVELQRRRQALLDNPFDPRTDVSADARHIAGRIVTHMWILFVLLPIIVGLLYALLTAR